MTNDVQSQEQDIGGEETALYRQNRHKLGEQLWLLEPRFWNNEFSHSLEQPETTCRLSGSFSAKMSGIPLWLACDISSVNVLELLQSFVRWFGQKTTVSARLSLSDAPVSSGAEDVVVSSQHVQRLPSLPHWWEWLWGTCPDRVGGYGPFNWKHSNRHPHCATSQIHAKPQASYHSSCDARA